MCEVNTLSNVFDYHVNLVLVKNVLQIFDFVSHFIGLWTTASSCTHCHTELHGREGCLVDVHLVVDLLVKVVTHVCLYHNWKMVAIPVVTSGNNSKKKGVKIVLRKRSARSYWGSKLSIFTCFQSYFTCMHLEELVC